MNMVIPNEGKLKILEEIFRSEAARESFVLDLFQNNETVDDASVAADFDVATFTGYVEVEIDRADWGAAVIAANIGQITKTTAPTFTCTGGASQTVYGWMLVGADSGVMYAGQNFDVPRVMSTGTTESLDPFRIKDKTFA